MNTRSFYTLWAIGLGSVIVWFWGDRFGIPKDAQIAAAQLGSGLIGYAVSAAKSVDSFPTAEKPAPPPQPLTGETT